MCTQAVLASDLTAGMTVVTSKDRQVLIVSSVYPVNLDDYSVVIVYFHELPWPLAHVYDTEELVEIMPHDSL